MHEFEWDDDKARSNLAKHHLSFDRATAVFDDPSAIELPVEVAGGGEWRYTLIGLMQLSLVTVVFTERGERIRIISARYATKSEEKLYAAENRSHD